MTVGWGDGCELGVWGDTGQEGTARAWGAGTAGLAGTGRGWSGAASTWGLVLGRQTPSWEALAGFPTRAGGTQVQPLLFRKWHSETLPFFELCSQRRSEVQRVILLKTL